MTDLAFYTNPRSRGRIVRWMLEEVGARYETVVLDYEGAMKTADYLAINPMGKVPAIVHDGQVVTEVAAICAYLATAFPSAGLGPRPDEAAAWHRWMFFAAGPLEAAIVNRSLGVEVPADKEGMVGYGNYDRVVDTLDAWLADHQWVTGDRFTAADVVVGSQVLWGLMFGSLPDRASFRDYADRLGTRDPYLRAARLDDALMPAKEDAE